MKQINKILNEEINHYILLEYGGFVNGWEKLINYIYNMSTKYTNNFLIDNNIDPKDTEENIKYYLNKIPKNNITKDLDKIEFEISESELNSCNIYGIEDLSIIFDLDNNNIAAGFVSHYAEINKNNKLTNLLIVINPYILIRKKEDFKDALQHELTHMYEFMMLCKKNNYNIKKAKAFFENHYYNSSNLKNSSIVENFSYYLSKLEINANVSALAYSLRRKNINQYNLNDFIKGSAIYSFILKIQQFKKLIISDNNTILDIIEFIKLHPEHSDMFPKIKSNNIETFKKRIISVLDNKLSYIQNKIYKVINLYLNK